MNNSLELYRIFEKVCQTSSFSAAAKELYITQPAVSQSIKQLEENLSVSLFQRGSRGVSLTAEGQVLLEYIRSALHLIESGEDRIAKLRSLMAGELKIGAGDTITRQFLLPHIHRFHQSYPDILLQVTNRTSLEILELLKNGAVDIAFVNLPLPPLPSLELTVIPCREVEDIFVAGDRFRHLEGRRLSLENLSQYPLIMLEPKSNSRNYVDRFLLSQGVTCQPEIELGAYDLLIDFARIGLGLACVIREFSQQALEQGGLFQVELATPIPRRSIGICHLSSINLTPSARRFIDLILS